jgi:hypothetical protein
MASNHNTLLVEALRSEIAKLHLVQREAATNRADFAEREPESLRDLRGIASNLADIYQGAEIAMQRIARATGEGLPSGREWHRELLEQMGREVTGVRPAVFRADTRAALEPFRSFRHLARHRYGFDLEWAEMEPLLASAESTVTALIRDLEAFCDFLDQI